MQWKLHDAISRWRDKVLGPCRPKISPDVVVKPLDSPARDADGRPPAPRELLAGREVYEIPLLTRSRDRATDPAKDDSLAALYRIYEHLVLDQHIEIRNELEAFWYHADWAVCDIPDPRDPHPERYACLACIPALLRLAFNKRIELGLPRDAPPIFTRDMMDEWRNQDRKLEEEPSWVHEVPALSETLAIPHWDNDQRDFVPLKSFENASAHFSRKNILLLPPHIHFI